MNTIDDVLSGRAKNILSLGAGVQSTCVLLMSCRGVLPKLDHAIFADTQWEPANVYTHLDWLTAEAAKAGIAVHRVTAGNLREHAFEGKKRATKDGRHFVSLPFFVVNPDGSHGLVRRRQCTRDYKIRPIEKQIRVLLGLKRGQRWPHGIAVKQWFGISADEANRVRQSRIRSIENVYPLVYELGMTRADCVDWMAKNYPGLVVPRSACIGCPYHSNEEWRRIRSSPTEWADAVNADTALREQTWQKGTGRRFLHRGFGPLATADIDTDPPPRRNEPRLFRHECMGVCGV